MAVPAGIPTRTSPQFDQMVRAAISQIKTTHPDPGVRYVMENVPIFMNRTPTKQLARAAGCEECMFLGAWSAAWPGYPQSKHGIIWTFEDGIVRQAQNKGISVPTQIEDTLIHEAGHSLGRDHVLDEMRKRARPLVAALYASPPPPSVPFGYITPRDGIRRHGIPNLI